MPPGLVDTDGDVPHRPATEAFPDGLKTSGQHDPIQCQIRPYEDFPARISGPTVWKAEDFRNDPDRWTHRFSLDEIEELGTAADNFIAAGTPLTGISQSHFPLPNLSVFLEFVRKDLIDGKGFFLFKGLPVREWGGHKSAVAYMGLGTYLGYFVSQNGRGHVLGHVKDLGEDPTQTDRVRIYRTSARQFFHTDGADLVGLLCMARALSGGESDIVSTHNLYNVLQTSNPDVVRTLAEPNWYFDRKGEASKGQKPWIRSSILYLERRDPTNPSRVWAKFDPMNLTSLARFEGQIPPLSTAQRHALDILEKTCLQLALHMVLEPGDIQLLSNLQVLHARTAYKDYPPGALDENGQPRPRRHLMRLWLATPEGEGGWRLPFHDTREKKRGGIQLDDTPVACPLDAE